MLAPDGLRCPVGADRHQAQEGIQVETAQRADVGAHPEVALGQEGLGGEWDANGQRGSEYRQWGAGRIEPGNARRGQDELATHQEQLSTQLWQEPYAVQAVAALGHIRGEAAVEVAVAEPWDLLQKRHAEADFELAPGAQDTPGNPQFQQEQQRCQRRAPAPSPPGVARSARGRARGQSGCATAGPRRTSPAAARSECRHQDGRGQQTVGAQQPEQHPPRPARRLGERGNQLRRELGRSRRQAQTGRLLARYSPLRAVHGCARAPHPAGGAVPLPLARVGQAARTRRPQGCPADGRLRRTVCAPGTPQARALPADRGVARQRARGR